MKNIYKKIAVPKFRNRISPVFDMSCLLVVITDGEDLKSELVEFGMESSEEKIEFLKELGVELVLCSGISENFANRIRSEGIEVVDGYRGNPINQVRRFLLGKGPGKNCGMGRGFGRNCKNK